MKRRKTEHTQSMSRKYRRRRAIALALLAGGAVAATVLAGALFVPKVFAVGNAGAEVEVLAAEPEPLPQAPEPEPDYEALYWQAEQERMTRFVAEIDRPAEWTWHIIDAARENNLSPWLIAAIITTESDWDAETRGEAGEYGLMQLMPTTALDTAEAEGLTIEEGDLFDPAVNIRLGAAHLGQLVEEYGPESLESLAAYNAGRGGTHLEDAKTYAVRVMARKMELEEAAYRD